MSRLDQGPRPSYSALAAFNSQFTAPPVKVGVPIDAMSITRKTFRNGEDARTTSARTAQTLQQEISTKQGPAALKAVQSKIDQIAPHTIGTKVKEIQAILDQPKPAEAPTVKFATKPTLTQRLFGAVGQPAMKAQPKGDPLFAFKVPTPDPAFSMKAPAFAMAGPARPGLSMPGMQTAI